MNENGLAKNIKRYRKENGLSQEKLSEYMEVSRQAVTKWENDTSRPSSDNLIKLAELFEISVDVLLGNEEQKDLPNKAEITVGNMPWLFIGISVLCILAYIIISVKLDVFSIGTLICMFILCFPIQLFLNIYFTNAINSNTFNGIAGFDDKIDYNISEVKKMLVQINLHIGITSTVYIFLFCMLNCANLEINWINGFLIVLYTFEIIADVIINNYKMINKIYRNEEDKKRAKLSIPLTIIYVFLLFMGMGIISVIFEIKKIENNSLYAMKLGGFMLFGVAFATIGFLLENRQIKKWNFIDAKYKINKASVASLCLCMITYVLMFFI